MAEESAERTEQKKESNYTSLIYRGRELVFDKEGFGPASFAQLRAFTKDRNLIMPTFAETLAFAYRAVVAKDRDSALESAVDETMQKSSLLGNTIMLRNSSGELFVIDAPDALDGTGSDTGRKIKLAEGRDELMRTLLGAYNQDIRREIEALSSVYGGVTIALPDSEGISVGALLSNRGKSVLEINFKDYPTGINSRAIRAPSLIYGRTWGYREEGRK